MEAVNIIALSMGAAWASGINLYATIFMLGYMGITGNIVLPDELQILTDPMVMAAAGFMYCVEFFADKIPGVDSGWDTMHTFIRIPAGAMLAAGAVGDVSAAAELSAALLGGTLAAGSHATKAGGRLLINTSPEPVTNWGASISEDLLVIAGLWTALHHPVLFLILLVVFVALMIWLLPRLWRLLKAVFSKVGRWLGLTKTPESSMGESTTNTEDTPVKKIEHDPN
ncbi:DUF4126 domain-containing protein [Methylophaga sp.]|uniref:DUF4126 domain-containing protein n=1 Tax=Methylophaga sp. TaxID=2024840 RepID=UPI003A908E97